MFLKYTCPKLVYNFKSVQKFDDKNKTKKNKNLKNVVPNAGSVVSEFSQLFFKTV